MLTFWAVHILNFVPYAFLGIFTIEAGLVNLALAPVALLGAGLGASAHRVVPERVFFAITYVLLLTTGSKLIFDALT